MDTIWIVQVLHLILGQLGLEDMQIAGRQFIGPYSTEELEDVLTYMVDIATTLWYFVDTASEAAPILMAGDFSTKYSYLRWHSLLN